MALRAPFAPPVGPLPAAIYRCLPVHLCRLYIRGNDFVLYLEQNTQISSGPIRKSCIGEAGKEKRIPMETTGEQVPQQEAVPGSGKKKRKKYKVDIFRGWCKCCGICAAFCPRGCIALDAEGSPFLQDEERCTGCGWCEIHCPDFAISVLERSEKAAGE